MGGFGNETTSRSPHFGVNWKGDQMPSLYPDITGVILAGGKSSRFGKNNKALAKWRGKSFVERIHRVLNSLFPEVLLVTNTPEEYTFLPLAVYCDEIPQQGPLGGIYTALKQARSDRVLVVACDMPLISPELIHRLIDSGKGFDAVIPVLGKQPQYLMGLYSKSLLPAMRACLQEKKLAMKDFCEKFPRIRLIPVEGNFLFNVNTPEDFKQLEKLNA